MSLTKEGPSPETATGVENPKILLFLTKKPLSSLLRTLFLHYQDSFFFRKAAPARIAYRSLEWLQVAVTLLFHVSPTSVSQTHALATRTIAARQ